MKEKNQNIKDLEILCHNYKTNTHNLENELKKIKDEHRQEIKILQDKLENIALESVRRPTHTYNNKHQINTIIQNMAPISLDDMKEESKHLTLQHIQKGVRGYIEYAMNHPLKNKVLCVDYSRRKIKYKDENGNIQTDPEMNGLSKKFFKSIQDKNRELATECVNELSPKLDAEQKMKIMMDMGQLMVDVNQGARGSQTEFTHDFVKGICSESVK